MQTRFFFCPFGGPSFLDLVESENGHTPIFFVVMAKQKTRRTSQVIGRGSEDLEEFINIYVTPDNDLNI